MFLFWVQRYDVFCFHGRDFPKGVGENPYFFILCLRSSIYDKV